MKMAYDENSRGLWIQISEAKAHASEDIAPGVVADYDRSGRLVAIEIEDVNGIVDSEALRQLIRPKINSGADIRMFREQIGLTQDQLGAALGIPRNTIARWERNELEIERRSLIELALAGLMSQPTFAPKYLKASTRGPAHKPAAIRSSVRADQSSLGEGLKMMYLHAASGQLVATRPAKAGAAIRSRTTAKKK